MQLAIGRRWTVVVALVEEPKERSESSHRQAQVNMSIWNDIHARRLEHERAALAAMAWWYGLYGPIR